MAVVQGECVSCGRFAGRFVVECPYCGESVWLNRWYRVGRVGLVAGLPLLMVALVLVERLKVVHLWPESCWSGLVVAVALAFALMPCDESGLVAPTRGKRLWWQVQGVGGSLLMLAGGVVGGAGVAHGSGGSAMVIVAVLLLLASLVPLFWPVPRRGWVVVVLSFTAQLLPHAHC